MPENKLDRSSHPSPSTTDAGAESIDPVAAAIYAFAHALSPQAQALPQIALSASRRRRLGATIFPGAPRCVCLVGDAMARAPALFAEYPKGGVAILSHQQRADAWRIAKNNLQGLLQIASDGYLMEQAEALRIAREAISLAQQDLMLPLRRSGGAFRARRYLALRPGAYLLIERAAGRQNARRRNKYEDILAQGLPQPMSRGSGRNKVRNKEAIRSAASQRVAELLATETEEAITVPGPTGRKGHSDGDR